MALLWDEDMRCYLVPEQFFLVDISGEFLITPDYYSDINEKQNPYATDTNSWFISKEMIEDDMYADVSKTFAKSWAIAFNDELTKKYIIVPHFP